jgi:hypothetical protein
MSRARDTANQINRINSSAADATAITVDSSENVGVGLTPSSWWSGMKAVETQASSGGVFASASVNGHFLTNAYYDGSNWKHKNNGAAEYYSQTGGIHQFLNVGSGSAGNNITWSERVRIDSDGLKFHGDTAAANALDDYEEGTWTPTAVSNCTIPTIHNAGYTKVGNQVHLSFWIKTSNTASNIVLSGLPFEVTTNQRFTGAASDVLNLNNISTQILYLNLYFYNVPTGTNRDLMFGVSYKTNS